MNPLKNIADMWRTEWAPRTLIQQPYPPYGAIEDSKKHRWWIWLTLGIATVFMLLWFFVPMIIGKKEPPSTKKQYEDEDKKLADTQEDIEREMAAVEEEINEDIKEHDAVADSIDSADDDELLVIYDGLRAEHAERNASSAEDE